MKNEVVPERIPTGIRCLDSILGGGLPKGSVTVLAGTPGAGKTTLAHQICFQNASSKQKALIFQTLSEPAAKTMKYMSQFTFFDPKKVNTSVEFVDLGGILRSKGLATATKTMLDHIKRVKPALLIIDSFKVFDDLAETKEELRKFTYEIAVQLMAWEITAFLIGEYGSTSIEGSPLFSVVDGILTLKSDDLSGDCQRFIRVVKMRGTIHDPNRHPFIIGDDGIEVFDARNSVPERPKGELLGKKVTRSKSGISGLDAIIGGGIPRSSVNLLSGVSGSGKTLFILESLYRGAKEQGEKGILFSFELTEAQLCTQAAALGFDFASLIKKGMIEIVFIPQSQIMIEKNIQTMQDKIAQSGALRVGIDSLTVFLEKIEVPFLLREKVLQISTIIKSAGAIGFLTEDMPYAAEQIGRSGASESVSDGIILLGSELEGKTRHRSIEILKMRNTNHAKGQNRLLIDPKGLKVNPTK